ncbi:MAG: hypothetical protein OCU22_04695 [Canidatus Methanoxibalbensis ujae]|nr:hypothetical protein [Candidatus Methanoxibalbensis ujae]
MGEIMVRRRSGLGLTLIEKGSQAPQRRLRSTNCFETPFSWEIRRYSYRAVL